MEGLGEKLRRTLQGRICVMGVGNVDYGDDGFGVYLTEELVAASISDVIIAGTTPERYLGRIAGDGYDHLLVIDATDFGEQPGTVVFLNAAEIATAFPQISTHKISLGVVARALEEAGTRVWLLGVQPESLKPGQELSMTMEAAMEIVHRLLQDLRASQKSQAARPSMDKVLA